MDSDILPVLRDWGTRVARILDDENTPSKMLRDAADEIERLRAENARLSLDLMTALGELMEARRG